MDEATFQSCFPAFPCTPEELQKFSVFIMEKRIFSRDEWNKLKKEKTEPGDILREVALRADCLPRELAEMEANILNIPFIDLEATEIPRDVMKIFKVEQMVEHRIIPIKLSGQGLLVGMVSPTQSDAVFKTLNQTCTLALRPAKILFPQLERKIQQFTDQKAKATEKKGPRKRLGDVLIEAKYANADQIKEALEAAKQEKLRLGAYMVKKGMISNKQLSIALSKQFEIPFIDLEESLLDPVLGTLIPKKMCYDKTLCPVKKEDNKIVVAFIDPTDIITIDHIEMMTGLRVSPVVSSELSIVAALDKLYGGGNDAIEEQFGGDAEDKTDDALGDFNENAAPIIKLVNLFFTQAIQNNVSDIHIEPFEHEMRIRFRKDGTMKVFMTSNRAAHPAVVSRIKVMANLDIAETRMPQDGRIKLALAGRKVDVRVSCIPCVWGEKICMRLCDQGNLKVNLTDLGFEPFVLEKFMDGIKNPNGIILVTGPTGSGKTTTLYSALFLLNSPDINIMTAEDPVEYNLMGINQVQCHPDIGLDFSAALRSFLRQDPDTIMIGEIRDYETASIAIKAAMTGHLVISTLHTNDAPATIARLLNMGVEPFAVTTSVRVVEAQRLVKKICKSCYTEYPAPPDLIKSLGIDAKMLARLQLTDQIDLNNIMLAKGAGCTDCDNTGLKGRQGIYEVLTMTEGFRTLILSGGGPEDMRRQAMRDGMLSLRQSALYKMLTKKTTSEQVVETTMDTGGEGEAPPPKAEPTENVSTPGSPDGKVFSFPGIDGLTREISAFRNAMEHFGGGGGTPVIQQEILKQNLSDPLAQITQQVKAGLSGGEIGKILPAIHAQGQKMDFNLRNLVTHFSLPSLKPIACHLNELAEKLMLAPLKDYVMLARLLAGTGSIGTNLKVTKNLQANLPPIVFDVEAFRTIAVNLVVNALIAMPKGGEIKLVSRPKPNDPTKLELAVLDSGVGIPAEKHQALFSPFTPIGRKTLGLGLTVVKKLITACGGTVSLKSSSGNTLVVLEFPVKR